MTISYYTLYNPRTEEIWVGHMGRMREIIATIARYEPEDLPFLRGGHGDLTEPTISTTRILAETKPIYRIRKS